MRAFRTLTVITILAGACLLPALAHAQISSLPENQKLIDSYALTLENIRKVGAANELFRAGGKFKQDEQDGDQSVEQPLAKQWQDLENGDTAGVLKKVGLSARDYILTMTTAVQTMIDLQLKTTPRSPTNEANVELYRQHQAEIMKAMQ